MLTQQMIICSVRKESVTRQITCLYTVKPIRFSNTIFFSYMMSLDVFLN
uniref:Uncharacterized protein n=1 Tax=Anguilla anguilla TaxID=7936 RepID=A0A0E9WLK2_ANGAN